MSGVVKAIGTIGQAFGIGPKPDSNTGAQAADEADAAQKQKELEARRRSFLSLINTSPQGILNPQSNSKRGGLLGS